MMLLYLALYAFLLFLETNCTHKPEISTFEDVLHIKPDVFLMDVRTREEIEETGSISYSVNIPLDELTETMALKENKFMSKVGRAKPYKDQKIIVSCKTGVRAEKGAIQLMELGYTDVEYYKGSWDDWVAKINGIEPLTTSTEPPTNAQKEFNYYHKN